MYSVMVILLLPLLPAASEDVELTPLYPYPDENLLCKYLNFQQGNILEFIWFNGDIEVRRKTIDKPSDIFNLDTNPGNKITCRIEMVAGREDNLPIGFQTLTVGQFACNDGIDNDNDGVADFQDPGCSARNDKSEFDIKAMYCEEHPDNIYCVQAGLSALLKLCANDNDNPLCVENQIYLHAKAECSNNENTAVCQGREDIVPFCQQNQNQGECIIFAFMVQSCDNNDICYELTAEDKKLLCTKGSYDFCPPAEIHNNPGQLGEPCFEGECFEGVCDGEQQICVEEGGQMEEQPAEEQPPAPEEEVACTPNTLSVCTQRECLDAKLYWYSGRCFLNCPEGTRDTNRNRICEFTRGSSCPPGQHLEGQRCIDDDVVVPPPVEGELLAKCGDGSCEISEEKTCPEDCLIIRKDDDETNILLIAGILVAAGGLAAFLSYGKRRRRG